MKQWLLKSPTPEYKIFGENVIISDDWDHFNNITAHDVMEAGTHAQITYFVDKSELKILVYTKPKKVF